MEREFRGFGRVDQFDTETFEAYNADDLVIDENFEGVESEMYSPPAYTKNWFHVGPVQESDGDWGELDYTTEYWSGDPSILTRPASFNAMMRTLTRRGRRDALRTLRGTALRSELYAKDGSSSRDRPYSVKETQNSTILIDSPADNPVIKALANHLNSNCIFFPYQYSARESMWERGEEPKTSFSFTGEFDNYGQVLQSLSIAVPRGKDPLTGNQLPEAPVYDPSEPYRSVLNNTEYVYKDQNPGLYFVDRVKQTRGEEITGTAAENIFEIRDTAFSGNATTRILSHQLNYYDGAAFIGEDYDNLGSYGLLVRSESLMVTPQELAAAYGSNIPPPFSEDNTPNWNGYPTLFVIKGLRDPNLGYVYYDGSGSDPHLLGYYATGNKLKYDTQTTGEPDTGMVMAKRNVYDDETAIVYDGYHLLPIQATDPGGMLVSSEIDYRLLVPHQITDPNENVTKTAFNALGLVTKIALCAKDDGSDGDTLAVPGTTFEYDFFAFMNDSDPISVRKSVRENHINAPYIGTLPTDEQNATIDSVEYSDGYGRVVQARAQAEDIIYGNKTFGDSGLPADQTKPNQKAVGYERGSNDPLNVVVSGQKRYNNKGEVVEQYEPYFASGFDYEPDDAPEGVAIKMIYDALGRVVKTVNPDDSEQRVIFGIPEALDTPDIYNPTPWERYHYSPNDLASASLGGQNNVPTSSYWTPKSETIDPLGNVIRTTEHNGQYDPDTEVHEDVVMRYEFDIKGQLLKSFDPYDRTIPDNRYSTAGQMLRTDHIDRGEQNLTADALNLPVITNDAKGARSLFTYDILQRPNFVWARDTANEAITLRQIMRYGDSGGLTNPEADNLNGKLYVHNDEAGKLVYPFYDFKGNNLEYYRRCPHIISKICCRLGQLSFIRFEQYPKYRYTGIRCTQPYSKSVLSQRPG